MSSLKKYKKVKYLGKGSYGAAILVELRSNPSQKFVIKEIVIGHLKISEQNAAKMEAEVLHQMSHSNITMYVESFVESSKLYIVMEHADGGDLTAAIAKRRKNTQRWPEDEVMRIFVQLCLALKHVHEGNILHTYGPHVTEATFTAIGRLPKTRPDLMKPMILHDLSEVDHGEMALKDFIKLGGSEEWARARRITPEAFAMGATCRMLGERESPFAYLGYMYLFEALTPILTERAQGFLAAKGFPVDAQHFIDVHAEEDIAHAEVMDTLIEKVLKDYPEEAAAIEYGFDCFAAVYPLPIWRASLANAKAEFEVLLKAQTTA